MKRCARTVWKYLSPLLAGLVLFLPLAALDHARLSHNARRRRIIDNPDQFHLWGTNQFYDFAFTYDPHAADDWLFESAAAAKNVAPEFLMPGLAPGTNPPSYRLIESRPSADR